MAKAKTSSFYIRRTIDASDATPNVLNIDTSAYVDPADRQGVMIESVDFVFYNDTTNLPYFTSGDRQVATQLLVGNYTDLQGYGQEDLVASGGLTFDGNAGVYASSDVFPDVLGSQDGRIVVDDKMSLIAKVSTASAALRCAVLIKAKVVTLSNKDYMALALQTVAN